MAYLSVVAATWLAFNLPVMIVSFDGWKYFYTLSFIRGIGDASIYSVLAKFGLGHVYSNPLYYSPNIASFGTLIFLLFWNKHNLSLAQKAFFPMYCLNDFEQQHSMQSVFRLAPLAVINIASLPKKIILHATSLYLAWQSFEILFRITYFQNWISDINAKRGTPLANPISDH